MKLNRLFIHVLPATAVLLASCASYPTIEQLSRARLYGWSHSTDVTLAYRITDLDALNYADEIKRQLAKKFDSASVSTYGTSASAVTLSTLAGAASTAGWGAGTASGLGMAAGYVFNLGHIADTRSRAGAYEQAFTAIQAAEANFYFHQLGMSFKPGKGKATVVLPPNPNHKNHIPYSDRLTPDGETLYYRVGKTLKVLDDVLAAKIPNLDDLKEAHGEATGTAAFKPNDPNGKDPDTGGNSPGKNTGQKKKKNSGSDGSGQGADKENPTNTAEAAPGSPEAAADGLQTAKLSAVERLKEMSDSDAAKLLGEPATADHTGAKNRLQDKIANAKTPAEVEALMGSTLPAR